MRRQVFPVFSDYYGLSCNPFDKQMTDRLGFFQSHDHKEMTARLDYLKDIRGIGVFTAQPGMGKTCSLRCFLKGLNRNLYRTAYLCLSTVSITEFYRQLCGVLGLESAFSKPVMFKSIQERVYYLYKEKKQPLLLALDEAQYLNPGILRDLKMVLNQDCDSVNCFSLILIGEPYLNNILEKPIHEALKQRITVHYNFEGLSSEETSAYIFQKLESAGGSRGVLEDAALSAAYSYSQGNPRLIDNVMTDALTIGAQNQKQNIDADVMMAAINSRALV